MGPVRTDQALRRGQTAHGTWQVIGLPAAAKATLRPPMPPAATRWLQRLALLSAPRAGDSAGLGWSRTNVSSCCDLGPGLAHLSYSSGTKGKGGVAFPWGWRGHEGTGVSTQAHTKPQVVWSTASRWPQSPRQEQRQSARESLLPTTTAGRGRAPLLQGGRVSGFAERQLAT